MIQSSGTAHEVECRNNCSLFLRKLSRKLIPQAPISRVARTVARDTAARETAARGAKLFQQQLNTVLIIRRDWERGGLRRDSGETSGNPPAPQDPPHAKGCTAVVGLSDCEFAKTEMDPGC